MNIQYLPKALLSSVKLPLPDLSVCMYQSDNQRDKCRVNLTSNVFSFLTHGQQEIHFSEASISVTSQQVLLIGAGNCLMTDQLSSETTYKSTLFFFSHKNVADFLVNYSAIPQSTRHEQPRYFLIEQDEFIRCFIQSLAAQFMVQGGVSQLMLALKFEEIMLYLTERYGNAFLNFLQALMHPNWELSFRRVIETNILSNLCLEEIAFLSNVSLSTFKRHFTSIYHETPGKWFQHRRLLKAKELLQTGDVQVSDIFLDFGYENLSNFSAAFKQEFGISPRQVMPD